MTIIKTILFDAHIVIFTDRSYVIEINKMIDSVQILCGDSVLYTILNLAKKLVIKPPKSIE